MTQKKQKSKFLIYKGKPLVRCGNTLYYGYMSERYVIVMKIIDTKKLFDQEISHRITVQLVSTNNELRIRDRFIKKTEKDGLYNAIDIGSIWLERALSELP